jgi:uncharacterized OB-fold protein
MKPMTELQPEAAFAQHLREGRFMIQRSVDSGRYFFYPRALEPGTGSSNWEWVEICGEGTVYSTTTVRRKPPQSNYNVALVDLKEGPRMLARIDGIAPEEVRIGMRVVASIIQEDGDPFVVFRLPDGAGGKEVGGKQ